VQQQLVKGALEPVEVRLTARLLESMGENGRPRVDRRINVAKVPLISGNLPARGDITLPEHKIELFLPEVRVDQRQREHVKREIPGCVPRILPLVWHRDDVAVVHVMPAIVPRCAAAWFEWIGAAL